MKGVTLIEVLITAAILAFIVTGVYTVFGVGDLSWKSDVGWLDLQQQARLVMDGMERELRQSRDTDMTISNAGSQVQFRVITDITTNPAAFSDFISYYLSGTQLIREYPGGTVKVLADNVDSLSFSLVSNVLTISVTFEKISYNRTFMLPFVEKVRLRNG